MGNKIAALFLKIKYPMYIRNIFTHRYVLYLIFVLCFGLHVCVPQKEYPKPPADGAHSVQNMAPIQFQTSFIVHQLFSLDPPTTDVWKQIQHSPDQITARVELLPDLPQRLLAVLIDTNSYS